MRHHLLSFSLLLLLPPPSSTMPPSSSTTTTTKHRKPSPSSSSSLHHQNHHHHSSSPLFCRHHSPSPTATLDLLILILVLISGTFLLTSYFSYLFTSLSLLLPSHLPPIPPFAYLLGVVFSLLFLSLLSLCRRAGGLFRPRRCSNPSCKGLKKALEFDLQLQTEDSLKSAASASASAASAAAGAAIVNSIASGGSNGSSPAVAQVDIERLPWKGGSETNPDYECLRAELRKMAPPNGRAVLLFRAKCGCPIAKLIGWGPKKGRKHKKALASTAVNGDHR